MLGRAEVALDLNLCVVEKVYSSGREKHHQHLKENQVNRINLLMFVEKKKTMHHVKCLEVE